MKAGTTSHHLVPRACHRKNWCKRRFSKTQMQATVEFCRDCHRAVHVLLPDEQELGRNYCTIELLQSHPAIAKFLAWVKKQK
jgi:hypothetical protein